MGKSQLWRRRADKLGPRDGQGTRPNQQGNCPSCKSINKRGLGFLEPLFTSGSRLRGFEPPPPPEWCQVLARRGGRSGRLSAGGADAQRGNRTEPTGGGGVIFLFLFLIFLQPAQSQVHAKDPVCVVCVGCWLIDMGAQIDRSGVSWLVPLVHVNQRAVGLEMERRLLLRKLSIQITLFRELSGPKQMEHPRNV